jgi:uncharacterized protein YbjQ (UPF0145 family)
VNPGQPPEGPSGPGGPAHPADPKGPVRRPTAVDPYAGWTREQVQDASIAEIAAGRLPIEAQRRLAMQRADGAFTSTMSVDELHSIRSVGFSPVGQVLGSCVYHIGYTGSWDCGYSGWGGWGGGRGWSGTGWTVSSPGWQPQTPGPRGRRAGNWTGGLPGATSAAVEAPGIRQSLYEARTRAMSRMRDECAALGGDGVVAVRLTVAPFPAGGLEFQAIGTAVRADGPVRPREPFLSDLSGQEFAALLRAGWVPCALVLGIAVMVRHDDWATQRQTYSWSNQEVGGYTELVQSVRAAARETLRQDCARHGGETVVVRDLTLEIGERSCRAVDDGHDHMAESMVIGTALVPFKHAGRNAPQPPLPILRL